MGVKEQEKVLHGLDSCGFHDGIPNICEVTECPYRENKSWCVHELAHDAGILIAKLLKAQEPVEPIHTDKHTRTEPITFEYKCVICNTGLMRHWVSCPNCGRAVKWDG